MAKSYFLVAKNSDDKEIVRTEWWYHIYEFKNARNRAWKWLKESFCSKVEIYSTEAIYTQTPAKLEATITENPYTKNYGTEKR